MERVLHAAGFVGGLTVEKLRVEKGQLLAGQGTGGQQSIRPIAKLVGAEFKAAARLFYNGVSPEQPISAAERQELVDTCYDGYDPEVDRCG